MKLSQFLSEKRLSAADFARSINVSRASVSRFCNGTRRPDLTTIQKIHEATNGLVRAEDFYETPVAPAISETLPSRSTRDSVASNASLKKPSAGSRNSTVTHEAGAVK